MVLLPRGPIPFIIKAPVIIGRNRVMNPRFAALIARIKNQRVFFTLLTLAVGIMIGTILTCGGVKGNSLADAALLPLQSPQQLSTTFGQIAKQMQPAVVNIRSGSLPKQRRGTAPGNRKKGQSNEEPFQDFFNRSFAGQEGGQGGAVNHAPFPSQ